MRRWSLGFDGRERRDALYMGAVGLFTMVFWKERPQTPEAVPGSPKHRAVCIWRLCAGTRTLAGGGTRSAVETGSAARTVGRPPCAEVAEMPDTELFLSLAEIAGVFVGFGALIALRSSGPGETFDVLWIGMVVWVAIAVVVIAIAPVAVSGFGITGHTLWLACSVLALIVFFGGDEVIARTSRERREFMSAAPIRRRWKGELVFGVLTSIPATLAFALVILGVLPEQEAALYFLAAALTLLLAALLLLQAVFRVGYAVWGVPRAGEGADAASATAPPATGAT